MGLRALTPTQEAAWEQAWRPRLVRVPVDLRRPPRGVGGAIEAAYTALVDDDSMTGRPHPTSPRPSFGSPCRHLPVCLSRLDDGAHDTSDSAGPWVCFVPGRCT